MAVKDKFGGKAVRVRGHAKVMTHLMFGILVISLNGSRANPLL